MYVCKQVDFSYTAKYKNLQVFHKGACVTQDDIAERHRQVNSLHSKIQNLTDLLVQARYNSSHDIALEFEGAASGKTAAEQVSRQIVCLYSHPVVYSDCVGIQEKSCPNDKLSLL